LRPYGEGLGAFEAYSRYSTLTLGSNVFTDHLANPDLFANSVRAWDTGLNWFLNEYLKLTMDWQHSMFNNPVSVTGAKGGNSTSTQDMYWFRTQLYY